MILKFNKNSISKKIVKLHKSSEENIRPFCKSMFLVQCLVEEESRLILYEGSKSGLAGFFDPCEDKDKHLVIQYSYRGQIHQAQIQDREQLRCPRIVHQLPTPN